MGQLEEPQYHSVAEPKLEAKSPQYNIKSVSWAKSNESKGYSARMDRIPVSDRLYNLAKDIKEKKEFKYYESQMRQLEEEERVMKKSKSVHTLSRKLR